MFIVVAVAEVVFGCEERKVAVVAAFELEFSLKEVFAGFEVSFLCRLILTVSVAGLAVKRFIFGHIVDCALLALLATSYVLVKCF